MPKGRPSRTRRRARSGFTPRPASPVTIGPSTPPQASAPPLDKETPQDRLVVREVKRIGLIAGIIFALFLLLFLFWR